MDDQGQIRAHVLSLMQKKDSIEEQIRQLTEILDQNGVGMDAPLVDHEGFPINTIDIYQVRHARQRIICLQNDHKALMKQIEEGLEGYYSRSGSANSSTTAMDTVEHKEVKLFTEPFAKVTFVSDNSPAYFAGILPGDEILEFGSVNKDNFKVINDIATVVQHSEGAQITVRVQRGGRAVGVVLVPKKWTGRGLLGCNIVAL